MVATLSERLADLLEESPWEPLPHQEPPNFDDAGSWRFWMLYGGRGIGKTDGGAVGFDSYMRSHPGVRGRIIAPTLGDAREACVVGVSGIRAHNPNVRFDVSKGVLTWPNGSRARIFGAHTPDDVERLRAGGNSHFDWYEELAAWRKLEETWQQADYGLRLGEQPRGIITTTPKPRPLIRWLLGQFVERLGPPPKVSLSRATTDDNPHLAASVRERLYAQYQGTRLGRQELQGELLEDIEGALWSWATLDDFRVEDMPELSRVVVAIDPAVTSGEHSDETGIVVAGLGVDGHGYVLADRTCRLSPDGWASRAIVAWSEFDADRIVAEVNNGGEMVERVIRIIDSSVPYRAVHASRGKRVRAEPIAALYEQGRVHHVHAFPELEDQMTTFLPEGNAKSPDRVDALVWALTDLMVDRQRRGFVAVA